MKKVRKIWMKMVNTTYNSTEDLIDKLQQLKGKRKLKFYKKIYKYYDEMKRTNFQTEQRPFSKNSQGISKIYHEALLLMKFLQTKPQVKNMNINYNDLYYTVIKNRVEKDNNENDYINFHDIITPHHYIGRKNNKEILR